MKYSVSEAEHVFKSLTSLFILEEKFLASPVYIEFAISMMVITVILKL